MLLLFNVALLESTLFGLGIFPSPSPFPLMLPRGGSRCDGEAAMGTEALRWGTVLASEREILRGGSVAMGRRGDGFSIRARSILCF
ncbi:hypothetical protein MRB53_032641 [Persea americana]|uniref:Uncharacterized protein n=1 Tax=Persea americana TaxID=3435 RepID=A0ACC2KTB8_PERAE|nr:hypothetical protein MRB53_032641 [Persea americana]